jgi:hemin uptake protein HemP
MSDRASPDARLAATPPVQGTETPAAARRIRSEDLFGQQREVEIDHDGRIYRLRLTQLNKLILTA